MHFHAQDGLNDKKKEVRHMVQLSGGTHIKFLSDQIHAREVRTANLELDRQMGQVCVPSQLLGGRKRWNRVNKRIEIPEIP